MAGEDGEATPSKFVIRKLPPQLSEVDFRKLLQDVCQEELEWFRYHAGSYEYVQNMHPYNRGEMRCHLIRRPVCRASES
jgi:hypothetical protein